ncbi:RNA polymerase sigma-70 factor [Mucilaginibacter daejeonensis]|uniref:RNA polymerase sigma factor n=1 Tax=Mucilaginibacter daejeonensis TaxID=398049 RepID=UPI001D173AA7|nr:RNA polymerase sigma-70 factor [Mucilaginibacter daejeonensis]UEG55181.1 RNA polymerase sigma-70 factor [Mucilaginibacter daejeonensis]
MMTVYGPLWWTFLNSFFSGPTWLRAEAFDLNEQALVAAFKAGDEDAFEDVFNQNFRKLYAFAFKMLKNKEQAEEIVNDAFLIVWANRDKLNIELPILPYLYTVTKRLAINSLRQVANSQRAVEELWKVLENFSNATEEMVLLNDLQRYTDESVSILPPQQQQVFKMSRFEGLSYDEIAQQLNISKNTVRNHLAAALKTLRSRLNQPNI